MGLSVLILTLNEEANLPACLESVKWCDDVLVFDSFSSDRTVEIARAAGARVLQRAFDDYGSQREAARVSGRYKYDWVLSLDADERPDEQLVAEMQAISVLKDCRHAAFRMRRKDHFMGRWIKHATLYPSWFVHFYRHDRIHYDSRSVHEHPVVQGSVGELKGHLLHYSFNKGLSDWMGKHIRYAGFEAAESLKSLREGPFGFSGLVKLDPVLRRRALKEFSFRLPFRPLLRFVYMYFLRLGFLDGLPGYHYCRLLAIYEYMIVLKMKELRRRQQGMPT